MKRGTDMPLLLMGAVGIALMCRGCNQSTLYARTVIHRPCTSLEVSYVSISKSSITLRFINMSLCLFRVHGCKVKHFVSNWCKNRKYFFDYFPVFANKGFIAKRKAGYWALWNATLSFACKGAGALCAGLCHIRWQRHSETFCQETRAVTSWAASRNTRGRKITSRWRWAILNHRKRNIVTM